MTAAPAIKKNNETLNTPAPLNNTLYNKNNKEENNKNPITI